MRGIIMFPILDIRKSSCNIDNLYVQDATANKWQSTRTVIQNASFCSQYFVLGSVLIGLICIGMHALLLFNKIYFYVYFITKFCFTCLVSIEK